MEFLENSKPYLKMFYLIGLSSYHPDEIHVKWLTKLFSKTLVMVQAIISLTLSVSCIIALNAIRSYSEYGRTDIIMTNMFIFCECARSIFVFVQCVLYKSLVIDIMAAFRKIELYFVNHLEYKIPYRVFNKRFFWIIIIVIWAYVQYLTIFILRNIQKPRLPMLNGQIKVLQAISSLTFLHAVFYIEALSFHLEHLNMVIERDMIVRDDITSNVIFVGKEAVNNMIIRCKLKYYKSVHLKLWELSQKINRYFGWCMVALLLQSFIGFVYTIYWLIGHLHREWTWIEVSRMNNLCRVIH